MPPVSQVAGKCAVCQATSVSRCARCQSVFYCGAEHQKLSWKDHKADCARIAAEKAGGSTSSTTLDPLATKFTWTDYQASSHRKPRGTNRPPLTLTLTTLEDPDGRLKDFSDPTNPWAPSAVFTQDKTKAHEKLIDAFRLWQDDAYLWKQVEKGLYAKKDPYPEFEQFVKRAKRHLPPWWHSEDTDAVLVRARAATTSASGPKTNIYDSLEKQGFNDKYGSSLASMAMRMWVDKFVDVTVGK